jgi:hypothetical protein
MSPRSAKSPPASASGNPPETAKPESKAPKKSVSSPERYTDPELREAIKADVLAGSKGGRPGQWSARKAQLVATEYKRRGGGYLGGPRTAAQKQIQKWDEA